MAILLANFLARLWPRPVHSPRWWPLWFGSYHRTGIFPNLKPGCIQPVLREKMLSCMDTSCAIRVGLRTRDRCGKYDSSNWGWGIGFLISSQVLFLSDCFVDYLPSLQPCFLLLSPSDCSSCLFVSRSYMKNPFACHLHSVSQKQFTKMNGLHQWQNSLFLWKLASWCFCFPVWWTRNYASLRHRNAFVIPDFTIINDSNNCYLAFYIQNLDP